MKKSEVVIVSAARTPIGSFLGELSSLTAPQLGTVALRAAVSRAGLEPAQIEQVIMGNVLQGGVGQAPARQAARGASIPDSTPTYTVNKVCGSGLQAVINAVQIIADGDAQVVAAGGMESMSNAPYFTPKMRTGARMGNQTLFDLMVHDGLTDAYDGIHMGICAEQCADTFKLSREAQDAFAKESTERAIAAARAGYFREEIVPVQVPQRKGDPLTIADDEGPKGAQVAKLASLKPAFKKDGTVTAGNASSINDGAAALVLTTKEHAQKHNLKVLAVVRGYATAARAPVEFTIAPNDAIRKLLTRTGVAASAVEAWEINEAFAAVALANNALLELDPAKVNVWGGAIVLGHPLGASGARVLVTLLHVLKERKQKLGVASLCIGGGEAVAMMVERVS